jgi:MYXO-CTERM domain-containing protein
VLDSADNLHIVLKEYNSSGDPVAYTKLDRDGNVLIGETQVGVSGAYHPTASIGLDSNENVHIAWSDESFTSDDEIYYAMLDGSDGSELIAATLVTADDGDWEKHTSLIVDNDLVTIVWASASSSTSAEEIYLMRLNPALDDQDGDAADPLVIKTVAETRLTPDNGATNWYVTATQGADGNLNITSGAGTLVGDVPISYLKTDLAGNVLIAERALTSNVHDYYALHYYAPVVGNGAYLRENVGGVDSIVRWRVGANSTVMTATATGIATATVNSGLLYVFEALALTDLPVSAQAGVPTDATFVDGFFGLVIDGVPTGGTVNVTLDLPGSFTAGSDLYYKWDAVNGWQSFPYTNGATTNQVLLTLTDGGAGDADGVANGQIVDPGGPGSKVASVPDVVGMREANAGAAIVGAGLILGTVTTANSSTVPIGDVISQNPSAGTDVAPGSTVDIDVSLGASVAQVTQVTSASSNGLFGCSVGSGNGPADPTLPLLVLISVLYLTRRRWMRAWQA